MLYAHPLHTQCMLSALELLSLHWAFKECAGRLNGTWTECAQSVHGGFSEHSQRVNAALTECLHPWSVHVHEAWTCIKCARSVYMPCLLVNAPFTLHKCYVHPPCMLYAGSMHAPCIFRSSSLHFQCTLSGGSVHAPCTLHQCLVHAWCTLSAQGACKVRLLSVY